MSAAKSAARALLGRFGYELVPLWSVDELPLRNHLRALFGHLRIDTVLDVGANIGQYHDFLRRAVGFDGVVHSFEPVADLAARIEERLATDPHWRLHRYALGESSGHLTINVAERDTFSSFLEPGVDETSRFAQSVRTSRREAVDVRRLDDVWSSLAVDDAARTYLKIDTQGFDLHVLRGGTGLLRGIKALQFELSIQPIYRGTLPYRDMLRELEDRGFEISGLFPISTDERLRAVEYDCVMVARDR